MPQPCLAEPAPPSPLPPAPQHQVIFGWAGDEPVGVWAREPGSLPWDGLDRVVPHVPGKGWAEDGPWRLLLQWASLPHATWDTTGVDLLNDIWQVERHLRNWNSTEQMLKASEPAASRSWYDSGPCYMDAVCLLLAASTAVMSVSWAVCSLIPVCVCACVWIMRATPCWFYMMTGGMWEEWRCRRKKWEKTQHSTARVLSQDCTAALKKVTEMNWSQLNAVASSLLCAHWFLFFTQLAFWTGFQRRGRSPASLGNDFTHIKTCYASADPVIPYVMSFVEGS